MMIFQWIRRLWEWSRYTPPDRVSEAWLRRHVRRG